MANNITSNQNQGPPVSIPNHAVNKPTVNTLPTSNRKSSINNDKQPTIPIQQQSVAPTTIPHPPKSVAVPAPSPDTPKPAVISPLASTYTDPLEHSLASLESDIIKSEPLENTVHLPPNNNPIRNQNPPHKTEPLDDISTNMVQMPPMVTNPLGNPNVNSNPNLNPPILQSGMGMDIKPPNLGSGGLGNMLSTNSMLQGMHANMEHDNMQQMMHSNMNNTNIIHPTNNGFNIKHEYDMPSNNNGLSSMGIPMNMSIPSMFDPLPQPVIKKEQPLLQPKPIEELTENVPNLLMDKKPTPPEHKHSQSFNFKSKQEQNVKNASSWSSLAQASSPQNTSSSGTNSRQQVMDSFKAFQNKAKEKMDREKQRLENLELKRQQKEQAEKERLRVENERRREKEEEDALEKAR